MNADEYYGQLGNLVATMPGFDNAGEKEMLLWLGKASALAEAGKRSLDAAQINIAAQNFRQLSARTMTAWEWRLRQCFACWPLPTLTLRSSHAAR